MRQLRVVTGARIVPMHMYAWGLQQRAQDGHLLGLSDLHAECLKEVVALGVPSRWEAPLRREEAKNHASVGERAPAPWLIQLSCPNVSF